MAGNIILLQMRMKVQAILAALFAGGLNHMKTWVK
jgi:hypothetical protein